MLSNSSGDQWSITRMLENSANLGEIIGGGVLTLFGVIGIVTAVVFFFMKLLSDNSRRSWLTIIGLFLLGGLALAGGFGMFADIAEGAQTTVGELGK